MENNVNNSLEAILEPAELTESMLEGLLGKVINPALVQPGGKDGIKNRITPQGKVTIRNRVNQLVNQQVKKYAQMKSRTPVADAVIAAQDSLPESIRANKSEYVVEDGVIYVKVKLSLSGITRLFDDNLDQKDGLNNVDKARIRPGEAFLVTGISLLYGTTGTGVTDPVAVDYFKFDDPDTYLKAGLFSLTFGQTNILNEMVIDEFFVTETNASANDLPRKAAVVELARKFVLTKDHLLRAEVEIPAGYSMDSSVNHYLYLKLYGGKIRSRGN